MFYRFRGLRWVDNGVDRSSIPTMVLMLSPRFHYRATGHGLEYQRAGESAGTGSSPIDPAYIPYIPPVRHLHTAYG
jgi:hypothetical protein